MAVACWEAAALRMGGSAERALVRFGHMGAAYDHGRKNVSQCMRDKL